VLHGHLYKHSGVEYMTKKTFRTSLYEAGMYETLCFVTSTESTLAYYHPEAIILFVTKLKRIGREDTSWMWGMEKPT